ncbi:hypothetical protein SERLA73DRAFT_78193 [Serpula lacrymans var. lacrymans S7.3]|uniref:Protein kinase domain-containing protein n=2 Tax=Serpula lacrymans var. lacrymans TaxID=341189 RepID=F8QCF2_SERL3|nr:hypothetical protein SERLA73DRAFT_78193 [Serpula lacrymans var. lacrymans S7.3]
MLSRRRQRQAEEKAEEVARLERSTLLLFGPRGHPGRQNASELWWCKHYQWLKDSGYLLRRRYAPDWVPSWQTSNTSWLTMGSDGAFVTLKLFKKSRLPYEIEIGQLFSTEPLSSDPANHCVLIYDVLVVPDEEDRAIIVMPLLRFFDDPPFDTFGEVIHFLRQIFAGLRFMHKQHIAHRDCMYLNIMMDATPLFSDPYHPQDLEMKRDYTERARHFTRTQRPPKYLFVDFGISRRYGPNDIAPLEDPIWGGDKTVPEFQQSNEPRNPFPTDVYYLGNMIRNSFLVAKAGFEFVEPLVKDMVQDDPEKRPNMDEVILRFEEIIKQLSSWKLRSRVINEQDDNILGFYRCVTHWARRFSFVIRRVSAIPTP